MNHSAPRMYNDFPQGGVNETLEHIGYHERVDPEESGDAVLQ
ncbi:MAG: hypothetical protein ACP5G0_05105 [Desulfomonilia bacterium]